MSEVEGLALVTSSYEAAGRELAQMQPEERRRIVAAMVAALNRTAPAVVADLAACASFTVLLGGAK